MGLGMSAIFWFCDCGSLCMFGGFFVFLGGFAGGAFFLGWLGLGLSCLWGLRFWGRRDRGRGGGGIDRASVAGGGFCCLGGSCSFSAFVCYRVVFFW